MLGKNIIFVDNQLKKRKKSRFVYRNMEVIGIVGEGREDAWRTIEPPRLLMQRVHIPFTFKLRENAPIGYNGKLCLLYTS